MKNNVKAQSSMHGTTVVKKKKKNTSQVSENWGNHVPPYFSDCIARVSTLASFMSRRGVYWPVLAVLKIMRYVMPAV